MKIHLMTVSLIKETGMMEKLRWMHPHNEEAAPDLSYSNTIFAHSLLLWVCVFCFL